MEKVYDGKKSTASKPDHEFEAKGGEKSRFSWLKGNKFLFWTKKCQWKRQEYKREKGNLLSHAPTHANTHSAQDVLSS
jgi:hypothetical protein